MVEKVLGLEFDDFVFSLIGHTQYLYARYGYPIYLVGSALEKPNPRDTDLRIVIPDVEFFDRFGPRDDRWYDEMAKQNRQINKGIGRLNVDFQIQSESQAHKYQNEKRMQIYPTTKEGK